MAVKAETVVVTGSSGFLGAHLICGLGEEGYSGLAVKRTAGSKALPDGWVWSERASVLAASQLDITADTLVHLEVKQHVVNLTASALAEFQSVNVEGTQTWLDWCTRHGVGRFVYFSSIKAVRQAPCEATDESAVGPPSSMYGASKWAAEERVRAWVVANPHRSALILRPAVIYGPGSTANIAAMVKGIRRKRFFLVGRNDNVKSLVGVRNVVAAVTYLLPRMQTGRCEVFNLVDAQNLTVREIDAAIRRQLGRLGNSPSLPFVTSV